MRFTLLSRDFATKHTPLSHTVLSVLLTKPALLIAADEFVPRFWTGKKRNPTTSTFGDA